MELINLLALYVLSFIPSAIIYIIIQSGFELLADMIELITLIIAVILFISNHQYVTFYALATEINLLIFKTISDAI